MYRIDIPRRVGEGSRTPKRRRADTPNSSNTTPPSSARRSIRKKRVKHEVVEEASEEYYSARAILKEEIRKGKVHYLIDWDDNKVTGEPFEPTWEPYNNATPSLVAEWQNRNLEDQRRKRGATATEALESPARGHGRPTKRRRLIRRTDIVGGESKGAIEEQRIEADYEGSQAATQETGLQRLEREIPDSYEEEGNRRIQSKAEVAAEQARVEIALPRDFDPGEYTIYSISSPREASLEPQPQTRLLEPKSSDPFESSQTSQAEPSDALESSGDVPRSLQSSPAPQTQNRQLSQTKFIWDEDIDEISVISPQSQSQTPTPNQLEIPGDPIQSSAPVVQASQTPYIWDSDFDDEEPDNDDRQNFHVASLEVPDSQEPDSSSYKPPETPSKTDSSTNSITLHSTQTDTEASLEAIEFRSTQRDFHSSESNQQDSTESQFAQPASITDQESHVETPEPTSAQVAASTQSQTPISEAQSGNPHIVVSSAGHLFFSGSNEPARAPLSAPSWPVFRSQDNLTAARLESAQRFGQRLDQDSQETSGFQTQLPRVSCEEESGEVQGSSDERDEKGEGNHETENHLDQELELEALEQPAVEVEREIEDQLGLVPSVQTSTPAAQEFSSHIIEGQIDISIEVTSSELASGEVRDRDIEAQHELSLEVQPSDSAAKELQDEHTQDQVDSDLEGPVPEPSPELNPKNIDLDLGIYLLSPATKKITTIKTGSQQHLEPRSLSGFPHPQASQGHSQSQIRTQVTKIVQSLSSSQLHPSSKGSQEDPIQVDSPQTSSPDPEAEISVSQIVDSQASSSSKSSGYSQASSHLPSPPVEDLQLRPTIEEPEPQNIDYQSEPSKPIARTRRRILSSSMEPPNESIASASALPDATAMLKAKMAARKAERLRGSAFSSRSPTPALQVTNDTAASTTTTQIPTFMPSQAPSILTSHQSSTSVLPVVSGPNFAASNPTLSLPVDASQTAVPVFVGPVEASAPSPLIVEDTGIYEEEGEDEDEEEEESTCLNPLPLGREIYEVPLSVTSYTRDVYVGRVKIYKARLQSFLMNEVPDETLVTAIRALLEILQAVCIHEGILEDEPTQVDDHELQAKWAENISTKFIFLAELLEPMKAIGCHIIIIAQPGQALDELESLLIYHQVDYSRADRQKRPLVAGQLRVTIYPAGIQKYDIDPASLVIGFDPSYQIVPFLEEIRTQPASPGLLAPLVSLVITNSVEHIERCFENNAEDTRPLIKVASCVQQLMERVGALEHEGYYDPPIAASMIAQYMRTRPSERIWPLLPLPPIDRLDLNLVSSQNYSEEETQPPLQPGKRQLELDEPLDSEVLKRQRLTSIDGASNGELISSMITSSTQIPISVGNSTEGGQPPKSDLQRIADLEAQLLERDATISTLKEINDDLESRCESLETSITTIQPKYQEALNDRGKFEYENTRLIDREAEMKSICDSKDTAIQKLREKLANVEAELSTAQSALATSTVPEIAELEALREELTESKLETEREQRRHANTNRDMDYLRETYQNSSSSTTDHQRIVQALEAELITFREKSAHDSIRIHEIQKSNENAELRQENTELKARLKDIERDFEKKQEELRTATANGRRSTRGASLPQSPRMGAGNQGSSTGRPSGRLMYGAGSRGTSPAPGDGKANAAAVNANAGAGQFAGGIFGDALFPHQAPQPVQQKGRWGDHLQ